MVMSNMEWIAIARNGARDPGVRLAATSDAVQGGDGAAGQLRPVSVTMKFQVQNFQSRLDGDAKIRVEIPVKNSKTLKYGQFDLEAGEVEVKGIDLPQAQSMMKVFLQQEGQSEVYGMCKIAPNEEKYIFIEITPKFDETTSSEQTKTTTGVQGGGTTTKNAAERGGSGRVTVSGGYEALGAKANVEVSGEVRRSNTDEVTRNSDTSSNSTEQTVTRPVVERKLINLGCKSSSESFDLRSDAGKGSRFA